MKKCLVVLAIISVAGFGVQGAGADAGPGGLGLGSGWWGGGGGDLGPDPCKVVGAAWLGDGSATAGAALVRPNGADSGMWTVRLSTGDVFVGRVTVLNCRRDGGGGPDLNVADIEGVGWLNGERGYEFAATMHDHGDGPPVYLEDDFAITIAKGSTVISTGGLVTWGCITITPIA